MMEFRMIYPRHVAESYIRSNLLLKVGIDFKTQTIRDKNSPSIPE